MDLVCELKSCMLFESLIQYLDKLKRASGRVYYHTTSRIIRVSPAAQSKITTSCSVVLRSIGVAEAATEDLLVWATATATALEKKKSTEQKIYLGPK